ncbi:LysM peptidoglycan-binding domain-containing protein [Anaerobacillus sp. CMMVII]|uniref:LysM peptidoglycan-binding domain-containing protein n=1 Tax=Anaerobacillus sp. CMMVII TaxID=2755588 RepID=UPI0021B75756|nr:LysM peptidoglycan-binding domain-containing protein [Anaerobacillus sp. CMMVII]MCT8137790.1 LysM peptidoglycan-binding domain-containing protein [Anaerobacillus sp. CMMVII]
MDFYKRHELRIINQQTNEYALILFLDDQLTEFADEFGAKPGEKENLRSSAIQFIGRKYPGIKVTVVKVMVGGMLVSTLPLGLNTHSASAASVTTNQVTQASTIHYFVARGDTLWSISKAYQITVDNIKRANKLTTDSLQLNQRLIIPKAFHTVAAGDYLSVLAKQYNTTTAAISEANNLTSDQVRIGQTLIIPVLITGNQTTQATVATTTYTVVSGDSLSLLANRFGTTIDAIRSTNNLTTDLLRVGQTLQIPASTSGTFSPQIQTIDTIYTVVSGDSLSVIAKRFGTTVESIRTANHLKSDILQIGQRLVIPNGNLQLTKTPAPTQTTSTHTVVAGDNLWTIATRYNTTVDALRSANNLKTDMLQIGQTLTIPSTTAVTPSSAAPSPTTTSHTVVAGDSLWAIAARYGTTVDALRTANNLKSEMLQIGQTLVIPSNTGSTSIAPAPQVERTTFTYRVVSGDTLFNIANRFGVTVDQIRTTNQLKSDALQVGQALTIPNGTNTPTQTSGNTISYITHTVVSGDNLWNLSIQYGIPQQELMRTNNLSTNSMLSIGQQLSIPVHNIAVKPVVSARHGELLDWWTEAQYVFSIGKTAKITDLATGQSFYIKRTIGANHADAETVSINDTNIAKSIWGGFSWTPRAVICEVDGRRLAASMSFMPHDIQYITNNGITGHFDVYFSNSTRHVDGKADNSHQAQVERAAGLR